MDCPIECSCFDLIHFRQVAIEKHMNAAECENLRFDALCRCFSAKGFIAHKISDSKLAWNGKSKVTIPHIGIFLFNFWLNSILIREGKSQFRIASDAGSILGRFAF